MGAILGAGFTSTYAGGSASGGSNSDYPHSVEVLNGSGEFSIALTDANTYSLASVIPQEDLGAQSGFYRIDNANTTHLKGRADIGALASGKTVLVTYTLT